MAPKSVLVVDNSGNNIVKTISCIVLGCLLILLSNLIVWVGDYQNFRQVGIVKLHGLKPGVKLLLFRLKTSALYQNDMALGSEKIVAFNPHSLVTRKSIENISDLKGLVDIRSAADALCFVRLQTSPDFDGAWGRRRSSTSSFEIVDYNREVLPRYGCSTMRGTLASGIGLRGDRDGYYGLLSSTSFRKNGFTLPQISKHGNDYQIERWLVQFHPVDNYNYVADELQFVRETVGKDGQYHKVVLKTMPADRIDWHTSLATFDN